MIKMIVSGYNNSAASKNRRIYRLMNGNKDSLDLVCMREIKKKREKRQKEITIMRQRDRDRG